MKRFQILFTVVSLITIYLLSVGVRVGIRKIAQDMQSELPFTMESAYLYHFSNMLAENKPVSHTEQNAQYPEGINPEAKLSLTVDHILAWNYRLFFQKISYAEFLRTAQPLILCLSLFIVFWIAFQIAHHPMHGLWASLLYALSTNSILRSTGIEYSRENFALPFLFLHFSLLLSKRNYFKYILQSLTLALALTIWDGSQVYFILWVMYEILKRLVRKNEKTSNIEHPPSHQRTEQDSNFRVQILIHLIVLLPLCLFHPYLKDHRFITSPGMSGLYVLAISSFFQGHTRKALCIALPFGFSLWIFSGFLNTYHHMIELLFYKIKFLNIKPQDPALLPFDTRILWTPALHAIAWDHLQNILPLFFLAILGMYQLWKHQKDKFFFFLFFIISSFIVSLLFVRLEVYSVFFLACLIGSLPLSSQGHKRNFFWNSFIFLALLIEAEGITKDFSRFERPVPYPYLNGVVHWIGEHTPRQAIILANFGLSPSFLAYSQRGIVLHPKYESADIRRKTEQFAKTLFEISEEPFYNFCLKNGVSYYVHAMGTFQDRSVFSWRYMVNELNASKDLLAAQFEYGGHLDRFYPLYNNGKYRVYHVIWPEEFHQAKQLKENADQLFEQNQWLQAQSKYEEALSLTPNDAMIYFRLAKVFKALGLSERAVQMTKEGLKRAKTP